MYASIFLEINVIIVLYKCQLYDRREVHEFQKDTMHMSFFYYFIACHSNTNLEKSASNTGDEGCWSWNIDYLCTNHMWLYYRIKECWL